jgi:hypothetical protein
MYIDEGYEDNREIRWLGFIYISIKSLGKFSQGFPQEKKIPVNADEAR